VLDELDLVAFRGIDERDDRSARRLVRTVAERVAERGRVFGEGLEIIDLEGQMGKIRSDLDGPALIKFADFDQLLAARGLEENEMGAASAHAASDFLEA